ncbi:MAG: PDZ domain-containing protein [Verrucomicrobiota bacterium]
MDGQPVPGLIELNRRLVAAGTRRDLRLGVQRDGERQRRTLTLRLQEETEFFNLDLLRQRLGLGLRPTREGCVVAEVEAGGPASARRLEKGMLVLAFDGQPAADVVAFAKAVHARARGETIELDVVFTRGWTRYRTTVAVAVRAPSNE